MQKKAREKTYHADMIPILEPSLKLDKATEKSKSNLISFLSM